MSMLMRTHRGIMSVRSSLALLVVGAVAYTRIAVQLFPSGYAPKVV